MIRPSARAAARPGTPPVPPFIAVFAARERARALARAAFPRRRSRVVLARTAEEFSLAFRRHLVDAALVDFGAGAEEAWRAAALAREFPSAPFFAILPLRVADGPTLARCSAEDFADVVVEGVDDGAVRDIVVPHLFSARFARALNEPPPSLSLDTPMQQAAWRCVVAHAGRLVRTETLAKEVGVTREHLSRTFSASGAPNLKRVIDLVRLVAAAELAKNPGYDIRDVASVLGFASSSHLSSTAQRVVGTKPASLSRLRAADLIERFTHGRARTRA
ncbi:MAG TPA: helix-turn-helix domain-containing protein [Gemmatimonadaceae bacterium]|nr:helix-turn-helix domain-containing protein [Gemmatimonadaceae bacterium]